MVKQERKEIKQDWFMASFKITALCYLVIVGKRIDKDIKITEAWWHIGMSSASYTRTVAVQGSNPCKGLCVVDMLIYYFMYLLIKLMP